MFSRFRQRSTKLERLDTGDYTPEEYARWHREMKFIHRLFGEIRALRRPLLDEVAERSAGRVTVLDVGAGSGEILRAVHRWLAGRRTLLVGGELNIEAARAIQRGAAKSGITSIQCNALELPFDDSSFDYVYCSLFLHHMAGDDAVRLLREMARVAARRVYVVDLHRSPLAYYFYRVAGRVLLQRFTREDGALSILRSFKPSDLRKIAAEADLRDIIVRRSWAYRLVLSARK